MKKSCSPIRIKGRNLTRWRVYGTTTKSPRAVPAPRLALPSPTSSPSNRMSSDILSQILAIKSFCFITTCNRQKAAESLREFKERRKKTGYFAGSWTMPIPTSALSKCIESLRSILLLSVEHTEFRMAAGIYQLLGEVMVLAGNFASAADYFVQAVSYIMSIP